MKKISCFCVLVLLAVCGPTFLAAQTIDGPTALFLMHSSGNHLAKADDGGGILEAAEADAPQTVTFVPDGNGYYLLQAADGDGYLALSGSWNTLFQADATTDMALFAIEQAGSSFVKLRCKYNGRYLGTDNTTPASKVYADKDGEDVRHWWYLSADPTQVPLPDTTTYVVNPAAARQAIEGWGVSLCWWANMCGKWDDAHIDTLVDWLVSPDGLNYRLFRYNIGGGDDPENRNCTPHHMGASGGKGLRAEMEGFKDATDGDYIWERDSAQRKIMLKIKERRPDAVFEAFSNSCPYYMTYSGCCAGNEDAGADNLRPEYYEEFAHYLVDVCKHYKEVYGIEFRTLSPFNEPMTSYWGANGGQEGCHFEVASQIAFLKVLSPILEASGLNTVISASDETDVAQSVADFEQYREAGVTGLLGQWNTHTYSASRQARSQISALCEEEGIRLWMSEVGSGGTGIAGNLQLAQKLIDDVRYIMPAAWVDWQFVEEHNDQWCTVRGSFADQTYYKVKNFSIRQHFSKFILPGYTMLTSLNGQTLAARNPAGDSLVVVALNSGGLPVAHRADLSCYAGVEGVLTAVRTTEAEDLATMSAGTDYKLEGKTLVYQLPAYSIVTFVIGVEQRADASNDIEPDATYWVVPRNAADLALGTADGAVTLQAVGHKPQLEWTLRANGSGYAFVNANEEALAGQLPAYTLTYTDGTDGQTFLVTPIGRCFHKITTEDGTMAFDLEGGSYTSGTRVGLWEYGSATASHRQWQFIRLPDDDETPDGISVAMQDDAQPLAHLTDEPGGILRVEKRSPTPCTLAVYNAAGLPVYQAPLTRDLLRIPLRTGIYIVRLHDAQTQQTATLFIK